MRLPIKLSFIMIWPCLCQVNFVQAAEQSIESLTLSELSGSEVQDTQDNMSVTENFIDDIEYGAGLSGEDELRLQQLDQSTLLDYVGGSFGDELPVAVSGGMDNWLDIEWEEVELLKVLESSLGAVEAIDGANGSISTLVGDNNNSSFSDSDVLRGFSASLISGVDEVVSEDLEGLIEMNFEIIEGGIIQPSEDQEFQPEFFHVDIVPENVDLK